MTEINEEYLKRLVKITVSVPVYNVARYLPRCIESICNQTYRHIEIILVDDGSTDESGDICDRYAATDNRIRVIHQSNGGLVHARKVGAANATGKYLTYVDGDDWVDSDYIENLLNCLHGTSPDIGITLTYRREFEDGSFLYVVPEENCKLQCRIYDGKEIEECIWPYYLVTNDITRYDIPVSIVTKIYNTDFIRNRIYKIDENISISEDAVTNFICFTEASSIGVSYKSGYHYRIRSDSMTNISDCNNSKIDVIKIANGFIMNYIANGDFNLIKKKLLRDKWNAYTYYCLMISNGQYFSNLGDGYLFPYPEITNGSKVFVYALSSYGRDLVTFINRSDRFQFAGVSDKRINETRVYDNIVNGKKVKAYKPDDIFQIPSSDYDYIVITTTRTNITRSIEKWLISNGIDASKIAHMDNSLFQKSPWI